VLPEGWMREAGASRQVGGARLDYGYMWWPVPAPDGSLDDGAYSARGIFGQFIYINPKHNIISVVLSARSKPKFSESVLDNDFWNAAVAALR
jgi:CubicO group peptidase (beta-lactamase class C family)